MRSQKPVAKRLLAEYVGNRQTHGAFHGMEKGNSYELVVCDNHITGNILVFVKNEETGLLKWRFEYYSEEGFLEDWMFRSVIIEKTGYKFINLKLLPDHVPSAIDNKKTFWSRLNK